MTEMHNETQTEILDETDIQHTDKQKTQGDTYTEIKPTDIF